MLRAIVENYRAAFRGLSQEVWLLAILSLINRAGSMVLPFLTLYLTTQRDWNPTTAGVLLAVYGAGSMTGIELGGRLTDRIGPKPVMLASLVGSGLGLFALGLFEERGALFATSFLLGLVAESFRPANGVAIALASTPDTRLRAYGLHRLAINIGWTIGPAIGGFLAEYEYTWLFVVDGLTCLAAAAFLAARVPVPRGERDADANEPNGRPTRSPWRDGVFLVGLTLTFGQAITFFQVQSTFPLFLSDERGFTESMIGIVLSVNTIVIVLFEMVLVHRMQRLDPLRVLGVAGLFVGLGFGLLPFGTGVPFVIFTILLWTIGEMLGAPVLQTWVASRASAANQGRYMAVFGQCFSFASIVAPLAGTAVYQDLGSSTVWYACLAIGAIQIPGYFALARHARSLRPASS